MRTNAGARGIALLSSSRRRVADVARAVPDTADRVAHSHAVVVAGRIGFAAHGVVYSVVGLLAVLVSVGAFGGRATGVEDSITRIGTTSLGRPFVALLAVGLFAYGLWRFVQAAYNPEDDAPFFARVGRLFPAAIYTSLAVYAVLVVALGEHKNENHVVHLWIRRLLELPLGAVIVMCIGAGFFLTGAIQIVYVMTPAFARSLELTRVSTTFRTVASVLSRVGVGARAVVFCVVGLYLLRAGDDDDARRAQSIGGALERIRHAPYGNALLAAVGLGFVAYGAQRFLLARYRPFRVVKRRPR